LIAILSDSKAILALTLISLIHALRTKALTEASDYCCFIGWGVKTPHPLFKEEI